jgi:predicted  nucleic acid-binding Zn-ribbon protein
MNKLNGMNVMIQNSLKQKKEFSDNLVAKLKDINQKIKDLSGLIQGLKQQVQNLEQNLDGNAQDVSNKNKQITDLTQKISALENDKNQLVQQLANFQKQSNDEKVALQQKIDADEAQIRKLTEDNTTLKNQADALTAELASRGDNAAQHAEEIKKQTEDFQNQMAKAQQDNQTKIDGLMAQVKDCDDKMLELQKQLKEKTDEAAAHAQSITDSQGQTQTQIAKLNEEIVNLKKQNDDLVQRIVAATQAIEQATQNLETLANSVPNQQSEEYINKLISEIEESIANISGVIQGRPMQIGPSSQAKPPSPKLNPNEPITIRPLGGPPQEVPFLVIFKGIQGKANQGGNVQKYKDALNALRGATNPADVPAIMQRYNIEYKNNAIMGGKKTKKMRKQKGGFTYKANLKRRGLSSSFRRSNSSRRSSR